MNLLSAMETSTAKKIKFLLTDIDDTLTKDGKLIPEAYSALWDLKKEGIPVIAVTGRASAWGNLLVQEWPVDAVITENGALSYYITENHTIETFVFPGTSENTDPSLRRAFEQSLQEIKRAKAAQDNHLRQYDLAIDYAETVSPPLKSEEVAHIISIFEKEGCRAVPSSIHINTWKGNFNKKETAVIMLKKLFSYDEKDADTVIYAGDARNDEPMFEYFPNACAVANISKWINVMTHHPRWVSSKEYGWGFADIVQTLISKRNQQDS